MSADHHNGILILNARGKTDILSRQYQSVFSKEDPSQIPQPTSTPEPTMPEIEMTEEGALKQLLGQRK